MEPRAERMLKCSKMNLIDHLYNFPLFSQWPQQIFYLSPGMNFSDNFTLEKLYPAYSGAVSYTHLTLPTIYSV